jgi:hypothetical protein
MKMFNSKDCKGRLCLLVPELVPPKVGQDTGVGRLVLITKTVGSFFRTINGSSFVQLGQFQVAKLAQTMLEPLKVGS